MYCVCTTKAQGLYKEFESCFCNKRGNPGDLNLFHFRSKMGLKVEKAKLKVVKSLKQRLHLIFGAVNEKES